MNPTIILSCIAAYFLLLFVISYITGKNDSNDTFFLGNRNSPWFVIAYGMIGTTLSGITFISVPGWVASSQFSYMQMVFGFFVGYFIIARILLPLFRLFYIGKKTLKSINCDSPCGQSAGRSSFPHGRTTSNYSPTVHAEAATVRRRRLRSSSTPPINGKGYSRRS